MNGTSEAWYSSYRETMRRIPGHSQRFRSLPTVPNGTRIHRDGDEHALSNGVWDLRVTVAVFRIAELQYQDQIFSGLNGLYAHRWENKFVLVPQLTMHASHNKEARLIMGWFFVTVLIPLVAPILLMTIYGALTLPPRFKAKTKLVMPIKDGCCARLHRAAPSSVQA
jgi:hypothetical protein